MSGIVDYSSSDDDDQATAERAAGAAAGAERAAGAAAGAERAAGGAAAAGRGGAGDTSDTITYKQHCFGTTEGDVRNSSATVIVETLEKPDSCTCVMVYLTHQYNTAALSFPLQ